MQACEIMQVSRICELVERDDWNILADYHDGNLLEPFNDHLSLVPAGIYRVLFHGPAYQVLAAAWIDDAGAIGQLADDLPVDVPGGGLIAAPRAIELCFQLAGVWALRRGAPLGLPRAVDELRCLATPGAGPVIARLTARPDGAFDAEVADAGGTCVVVRGYRTVAFDPRAAG